MFHSRRLATCCKLCFELYFTTRLDRWVIIPRNQNFYRQKKRVSQWVHWKNSGHTYLSLSWDSTAVRNKVVRSTWPRSVTASVKLWYFSDQTDVPSCSCGSFQRMEDDNRKSVMECENWNYQGKWSHASVYVEIRLDRFAVYVPPKFHWHLFYGYWYCNDPCYSLTKYHNNFWLTFDPVWNYSFSLCKRQTNWVQSFVCWRCK